LGRGSNEQFLRIRLGGWREWDLGLIAGWSIRKNNVKRGTYRKVNQSEKNSL